MTGVYADSPPLTAEQQTVVDQPWDARVLVTAGAGAGKTHTLVRRLDALMSSEDEALEAHEILVLSFSRAAVRELKERVAAHAREARRVRVQTFDSWAYALLKNAYPDHEWGAHSFDERIREAEEAIAKGAVETTESGAPAHVVIDEVQDLVGDRRLMVETLLDRFHDSCGFTMVGDPAQAIFGFQVSDPDARAVETNYFFDWLRASYPDDLVELRLSENFRARTDEAKSALPLGDTLQSLPSETAEAQTAGEALHQELRSRLLALPSFGDLTDDFAIDSFRDFPGTCAILCRDNGRALLLSETLFERGVVHRLQRSLQDRPVPAWVAAVLRLTGSTTLGQDRFLELLDRIGLPTATDPPRLWSSLRGAARGGRGVLDLGKVRRLIAEGRFPDDLTAAEPSGLLVSTVHRAKGLEFDRVVVVEPQTLSELRRQHTHVDPAAEARALYVAMTRARYDLCRLASPEVSRLRLHRATNRWYVGGWKAYERYGIEASGRDVCTEQPPGTDGFHDDPVGLQEYMTTSVRPGDPLVLRRLHDMPVDSDQSPPYLVLHADRPVAMASERFRSHLFASLKVSRSWEINWPDEIHNLRVDALESVAGSIASGARAGLGEHGVWLVPRVSGLGRYWSGAHARKDEK
ncbi:UvrD-helicase domain-containing protein [Streptomyces mirabilis]|uniref:UvrD-helicase domain-containing protein n=1 Tax=Streptomyces mirabilis TaxID=68239 RepID=UPI002259E406|nr:UvrD-helicase domain-containing protein [Streptomyces mirabilis]MCX4609096.1 UvrD-helicase domain-containing protein [Streptomyces mirabilis]